MLRRQLVNNEYAWLFVIFGYSGVIIGYIYAITIFSRRTSGIRRKIILFSFGMALLFFLVRFSVPYLLILLDCAPNLAKQAIRSTWLSAAENISMSLGFLFAILDLKERR